MLIIVVAMTLALFFKNLLAMSHNLKYLHCNSVYTHQTTHTDECIMEKSVLTKVGVFLIGSFLSFHSLLCSIPLNYFQNTVHEQ